MIRPLNQTKGGPEIVGRSIVGHGVALRGNQQRWSKKRQKRGQVKKEAKAKKRPRYGSEILVLKFHCNL